MTTPSATLSKGRRVAGNAANGSSLRDVKMASSGALPGGQGNFSVDGTPSVSNLSDQLEYRSDGRNLSDSMVDFGSYDLASLSIRLLP